LGVKVGQKPHLFNKEQTGGLVVLLYKIIILKKTLNNSKTTLEYGADVAALFVMHKDYTTVKQTLYVLSCMLVINCAIIKH